MGNASAAKARISKDLGRDDRFGGVVRRSNKAKGLFGTKECKTEKRNKM